MKVTIAENRRELFEASWHSRYGNRMYCESEWRGFNAALDAVVIELPNKYEIGGIACDAHDRAIDLCRAAIKAAGLKVEP